MITCTFPRFPESEEQEEVNDDQTNNFQTGLSEKRNLDKRKER
jgi:hypothetical protein